jgi:hypothetical protein
VTASPGWLSRKWKGLKTSFLNFFRRNRNSKSQIELTQPLLSIRNPRPSNPPRFSRPSYKKSSVSQDDNISIEWDGFTPDSFVNLSKDIDQTKNNINLSGPSLPSQNITASSWVTYRIQSGLVEERINQFQKKWRD